MQYKTMNFAQIILLLSILMFARASISATVNLPIDVSQVNVALNCTANIPNCIEPTAPTSNPNAAPDLGDFLTWIWTTRKPTATDPLVVNFGPGEFTLPDWRNFCEGAGNGYASFRGTGTESTVLTGGGIGMSTLGATAVIGVDGCTSLAFQDLAIRASSWTGGNVLRGVTWVGPGSSNWINVLLQSTDYGWYDNGKTHAGCDTSEIGTHYWFSSKIETKSSAAYSVPYASQCGETWFYGGEIHAINDGTPLAVGAVAANASSGEIRIFGSAIRVTSANGAGQLPNPLFGYGGLFAANGGKIHMHGGIVSVDASGVNIEQDVYGVRTHFKDGVPEGFIHTPDTAFALKAGGTGAIKRIIGTGAQSPFTWPPGTEPPKAQSGSHLVSLNGSDMYIETDCDSTGNCETAAVETQRPHIMIYTDSCNGSGGPWFDSTINACK